MDDRFRGSTRKRDRTQRPALKVRLRDENSDGKLEGVEDSLQVDLNADGQFDKLRESFPLTKFFRHQGKRYALQLNREARTLSAQAFDATGTIQLSFEGWDALEQPPTQVHVVLQSASGIQLVFSDTQPQAAPPDEYYVHSALLHWDGETKWRMAFSRWDAPDKATHRVTANQLATVPVLGNAQLTAQLEALTVSDNTWRALFSLYSKQAAALFDSREFR